MTAISSPIADTESSDLFGALATVETVHALVGQWITTPDHPAFVWQEPAVVRGAYDRCLPMTQQRFGVLTDQLCAIAHAGALHLLGSKDRRGDVPSAAAERLQRELEKRAGTLYRLVKLNTAN